MNTSRTIALLEAGRLNNMKFNIDKMQFKSRWCLFFGEILTEAGMEVDPKKVEAIVNMPPPRDLAELRSFMGMVNYMKRYSPVLTEMSAPLRELTKEGVLYRWELAQETAFQDIKQELTQTPVLAYFDARKRHIIQTDASQKGLGRGIATR